MYLRPLRVVVAEGKEKDLEKAKPPKRVAPRAFGNDPCRGRIASTVEASITYSLLRSSKKRVSRHEKVVPRVELPAN